MEKEAPAETTRTSRVVDILTVILLSVTAVLTAWCGFEASKWGGEMSIAFSQASSARIQAASAESTAQAARQYDLTLYTEWVLAEANGQDDLVRFVEERFTEEFAVAFDAWNAEGRASRGPLAMSEYVPPGTVEAQELSARADTKFDEALTNNQRGDDYSLLTVLFALVLFFAAISQHQSAPWRRRVFLSLAGVIAIGGIATLLTFPIKI
ncbi:MULTISPECIES: hypothetical protein [unclassified Microbacterium]|uniref:hypothetical protein n=1 Tax=unclassified Microbacterium TaxID=2609290 RepID=UPI000CFE1A3D|nr:MULTISPECIES: hypothetical protein [unclassified Microbacterium]PQZ55020.1 hypothetical protein CQ032_12050 [Microbacterium sp. MYb43]PQZ81535.1 hypothetical protein CQ031_04765 [Microbacterium sp. MYb40]PRB21517.1 hypothetical protein CQ040_09160 [Microbacterium sp. MYb54]PRB30082.1 hypothetical protein CQ037_06780 [Microbacterium sp. MYb50]PRB67760.1 hypothetical protein CQ021_07195 [Microbacterium sp. MYb24]